MELLRGYGWRAWVVAVGLAGGCASDLPMKSDEGTSTGTTGGD